MKKILVLIVSLATLYMASAYVRAYFWEKEAIEYSKESLIAIAKPWNIQNLLKKASPTLKMNPVENLEQTVKADNLLFGSLVTLDSTVKCKLFSGKDTYDNKKHIYATCTVPAQFEKKHAIFLLQLMQENNSWYINDLQVN